MITVRTPTGNKYAEAITVRTPAGDKAVSRIMLRTAAGDKQVYSAATGGLDEMTVSASPVKAVGGASADTTLTITSNAVTVSATGGTAPYTYSWLLESGSETTTANAPSSATTTFRSPVSPGTSETAIFSCNVTDAIGRTGSVEVEVTLYNF